MMRKLSLIFFLSLPALISSAQLNKNTDSLPTSALGIKVTLLGTGTPQPLMDRFGPSILVQAGTENLLFDAGRGCLQRLRQIKLEYDKLNALFLTHLHSDHIVGLPDLWLTGWLITKRAGPLKVFGPVGTQKMVDNLQKAFAYDIYIREEDDHATKEGSKLSVTDIEQGVIYEKNGVKVTAFSVDHGAIKPAFGYRVDYNGHSVVLSGDTKYSENLIRFAKGTDLLVHEVMIAPDNLDKSDPRYNITQHHTTPKQAAQIFNEVKPKLAAYSHIVKLYGRTEDEIMKQTKADYSGPLVMGQDLMSFSIQDKVIVNDIENSIRELEQLVVTGILNSDTALLKQLWAPEFMVNTPRNDIAINRDAVFKTQQAGLINYSSFERVVEKVEIEENTVITMGHETFVSRTDIPGAKAGQAVKRRFTNVWMKKNGQWVQVARHASIICP